MSLAIHVPLNTMLADLDESLRRLLRAELERHGFAGVSIAFDAPARDWAAALSGPTLNLFLYDLREATELRETEWREHRGNGNARAARPPLRLDCSYAVTAWTRAIEDEHRLLSQALAVLLAHQQLPADCLVGDLAEPVAQRYALKTRVGGAREDGKADFWNAIGGSYKASVDYVVTLSCEPGVAFERGPEVRSQTIRTARLDGGPGTVEEFHRVGGVAVDEAGEPLQGAWLVLPDAGAWAATDADGRFRFERVPAGSHRCLVRTADGSEAEVELIAPGGLPRVRVPRAAGSGDR